MYCLYNKSSPLKPKTLSSSQFEYKNSFFRVFESESTLFEPKFFIPDNQDPIFAGYGYNSQVIFIYAGGCGHNCNLYFLRYRQIIQNIYIFFYKNTLSYTKTSWLTPMNAMFRTTKIQKTQNWGLAASARRPLLFWATTGRDRPVPFTNAKHIKMLNVQTTLPDKL